MMSHYITWHHAASCDNIWHHTASCHVSLFQPWWVLPSIGEDMNVLLKLEMEKFWTLSYTTILPSLSPTASLTHYILRGASWRDVKLHPSPPPHTHIHSPPPLSLTHTFTHHSLRGASWRDDKLHSSPWLLQRELNHHPQGLPLPPSGTVIRVLKWQANHMKHVHQSQSACLRGVRGMMVEVGSGIREEGGRCPPPPPPPPPHTHTHTHTIQQTRQMVAKINMYLQCTFGILMISSTTLAAQSLSHDWMASWWHIVVLQVAPVTEVYTWSVSEASNNIIPRISESRNEAKPPPTRECGQGRPGNEVRGDLGMRPWEDVGMRPGKTWEWGHGKTWEWGQGRPGRRLGEAWEWGQGRPGNEVRGDLGMRSWETWEWGQGRPRNETWEWGWEDLGMRLGRSGNEARGGLGIR